MKFLAICSPKGEAPDDRFAELVPEEAEALRRLKARSILVEAWSPGGPGAVLILEAASEGEAEAIMAQLPLAAAGFIEATLTPLHDLAL